MKDDAEYLPKIERRDIAYAIAYALHGHPLRGHFFYPHR